MRFSYTKATTNTPPPPPSPLKPMIVIYNIKISIIQFIFIINSILHVHAEFLRVHIS